MTASAGEDTGRVDWSILAPGAEGAVEITGDEGPETGDRPSESLGSRLRLEMGIWDAEEDPWCCPSRGSFVAELAAHPREPRLVEASFVREQGGPSADAGVSSVADDAAEDSMDPSRVVEMLRARDAGFFGRVLSSDLTTDLLARTYSVSAERIPISETEEFAIVEVRDPELDRYVHVDFVLHRQQDQWSHVGTFDFMDSMTYDDCRVLRSPLSAECCRSFLLVSCHGYGVSYESWDHVLYRLGDGTLEPVFCRQKKGVHDHDALDTDVEIGYRGSGITVRGVDFEEDRPERRRTDVDDTYEWDGRAFVSQSGDALEYCDDVRDVRVKPVPQSSP
jgi:hypothetical protein